MRIALATPLYPPESGGPATYAKLLEEELTKKGHQITLIKFSEVRKLPKLIRHLAYAQKVTKAAKDADLVYALDPVSTGFPAVFGAMLARKPFYLRVAGDYAWEQGVQHYGVTDILDDFINRNNYKRQVQILKSIQLFVAKKAQRVVVPSNYLKRIVEAWGIENEKISIVYNAPGETGIPSARPLTGPYFVTAGRFVPWKGMEAVIHAYKRFAGDTKLVLVGSGPQERMLKELVTNEQLERHVIFTGSISREETLNYMRHAEAFILNTRYEGMSHAILEAFAVGVPVLTTPVGGNVELVEDKVTGLFFTYNAVDEIVDALKRIQSDGWLKAKVVTNAKEKVAEFTKEKTIEGTLQALS
jgi:glycosyltransferase involved in cell wall biosynthesis